MEPFKEGDWVMLFDSIRFKRVQKKFLPKYFGPFIVEKVWGNYTYDLKELGGRHFDRINHDKLKMYHRR